MRIICLCLILLTLASPALAGWSEPVRISAGGYSNPQIIALGDTLHVVSKYAGRFADEIAYFKSTDGGLGWTGRRILTGDTCQSLFPRILVYGNRILVLWRAVYRSGTGPQDWNIGTRLSTDGGQSWRPVQNALSPGLPNIRYFSASAEAALVNVVFSGIVAYDRVFYGLRSTDFGGSWSSPGEIFRAMESGIPDQISFNNSVHFVWDGRFDLGQKWEIRYIGSTDGGLSWSPNVALSDSDQFHSVLPSISWGSLGSIAAGWMDYKYSPYPGTGDILCRPSSDSGLTWEPESQASFTHYAWDSDISSNRDTIHTAWIDEGTGIAHRSIYYTRSTDNGETWEEPFLIDRTLDDSWDPALALSNGRVYIVWGDGTYNPDTTSHWGLYFSRYDPEPDAIEEGENSLPKEAGLFVYPNPFNSSTVINITGADEAEVGIYDITGRLITKLQAKDGRAVWEAGAVSSGVYFARVAGERGGMTLRLVLQR